MKEDIQSNKNQENWIVGLHVDADEIIWTPDAESFENREEAISKGKEMARKEGLENFRIGLKLELSPFIEGEYIINMLQENIQSMCADCSKYLEDIKEEHKTELEDMLNKVIVEWSQKNNYMPKQYNKCYHIVCDQTINVNSEFNKEPDFMDGLS